MNGRYSRQERFSGIGPSGQQRLAEKRALIVGAGALGSGNAETLVRAGVGRVTIVDRDYVEWSNLQRQQLYDEEDARQRLPKAIAARNRLARINSEVTIEAVVADVTYREIGELAADTDIIVDATDNFEARMLLNDASFRYGIPWVYGACVGSYGHSYAVVPGRTPCLACLFGKIPIGGETCDTGGIIAPAVQMVVAHQTAEALKLLIGAREALLGKIVSFDLWKNSYTAIGADRLKRPDCPTCGERPTYPYLNGEGSSRTAVLCGRDTVQIRPSVTVQRDLQAVAASLSTLSGTVEANPYLVSFTPEPLERGIRLAIFKDGRVLVHGTKDIAEARTVYHRYLGS